MPALPPNALPPRAAMPAALAANASPAPMEDVRGAELGEGPQRVPPTVGAKEIRQRV